MDKFKKIPQRGDISNNKRTIFANILYVSLTYKQKRKQIISEQTYTIYRELRYIRDRHNGSSSQLLVNIFVERFVSSVDLFICYTDTHFIQRS